MLVKAPAAYSDYPRLHLNLFSCQVSEADEVMAEVVCAEPSAVYHVQNLDFPKEAERESGRMHV